MDEIIRSNKGSALPALQAGEGMRFSTEAFSPAGNQQPSLGELLVTLKKNWRTVILALLATVSAGMIYCVTAQKKYSARATLEIGGDSSVLTEGRMENELRQRVKDEKYAQTQVAKLKGFGVADYVLSRSIGPRLQALQAEQESWLSEFFSKMANALKKTEAAVQEPAGPYNHSEKFLRSYLKLFQVEPVYNTSLVEIVATTTDPALARDIANEQAEGFIEYMRTDRHNKMVESLSFLQTQADELREKVAAAERELGQYAEENELLSLSKDESLIVKEIGDLTRLLSTATGMRIRSESTLRAVTGQSIENSTSLDDEAIRMQRVQLKQAEADYAHLAEKVTINYPALQELRERVRSLRGNIVEQRKQALAALRIQYESNLEEEQKLRSQVDEKKQAAFADSRKLVRYNILQREYDSLKELYQSVLSQLKAAQVSSASRPSSLGIVEYAAFPENPSSPKVLLVLCVSVGLGIALGAAIVAVKRLLDHTITSPDQTKAELRLPMLGVVPSFEIQQSPARKSLERWKVRRNPQPTVELPHVITYESTLCPGMVEGPANPASESFRAVRTNIMLSSVDDMPRVILVTSAQKGEGKTTVASNLAVTLAQAQNRTLIIDSDLRRGKLRSCSKASVQKFSLVDFLTGNFPFTEAISPTSVKGLDIMVAGRATPNPAELIGSRKFKALVGELRGLYDFIILDSPPVLSVADGLTLSRVADAVLFVVRSAVSEKRLASRAVEQLRQVQARIIGFVVNAFDPGRSGECGVYAGYDDHYLMQI